MRKLYFLAVILLMFSCSPAQSDGQENSNTISFEEASSPVLNPERGFYKAKDFMTVTNPLRVVEVKAQRKECRSLWYLGFYLTDFMEGDISQPYLDMIQSSFDALREGGAKCILRFAYKLVMSSEEDMEPPVEIVMRHAEQIASLLERNADVIFVLQAGFIGPWGEWHSSTHFHGYETRRQLIEKLMAYLPESRQIAVRTPQFKMRMFGLSVKDTITAVSAHDESVKSRLAGHNDCFGASSNDAGTFDNEKSDRAFWKGDSRYTIMGGETCSISKYCTCDASLKDMEDYHWTYLNSGYNSNVLAGWRTGECYDTVVDRLGYRLVMENVICPGSVTPGNSYSVELNFRNDGFAAPMNPRDALLVWETPSGDRKEFTINSDPRTWHPGSHKVKATFKPSSEKGSLYLLLRDPLLPDRPEFSMALANENVFDNKTGLNKLFSL